MTAAHRDSRIGIFSTAPVEVLFAAGLVPVDVNNRFVGDADPGRLVRLAEQEGVPRTVCAWTRGLFAAVIADGLERVVVVQQGECSNNMAMALLLEQRGVEVVRFHYPQVPEPRRREELAVEMERLCTRLGTTMEAARRKHAGLRPVREALAEVDRRMAAGGMPGSVARRLLLGSTDMMGDPARFEQVLREALEDRRYGDEGGAPVRATTVREWVSTAGAPGRPDALPGKTGEGSEGEAREPLRAACRGQSPAMRPFRFGGRADPLPHGRGSDRQGGWPEARAFPPLRLALFGVPTIVSDLVERMEGVGGQVVLCETERDFAMLPPAADLVEQYLSYAYPWGMARRLERFVCLARARGVCGVVVYGQTFCHHNLEVQVVEEALRPLPVLVLEGDGPGPLLPRDQMRLEAFAEVVRGRTFVEPMP